MIKMNYAPKGYYAVELESLYFRCRGCAFGGKGSCSFKDHFLDSDPSCMSTSRPDRMSVIFKETPEVNHDQ